MSRLLKIKIADDAGRAPALEALRPLRVPPRGEHTRPSAETLSVGGGEHTRAERFRQSAGLGTCTDGGSGGRVWSREGLGFESPAHAGRARSPGVSALFSMDARRISINYRELRLGNHDCVT